MRRHSLFVLLAIALLLPAWPTGSVKAQGKGGGDSILPHSQTADTQAEGPEKSKSTPPAKAFPGLADVVPQAAELIKNAAETKELISALTDTSIFDAQITEAENRQAKLREQLSRMGDPEHWDFNRLSDARVLVLQAKRVPEALVPTIYSKLTELESVRKEWEKHQIHWQEWKTFMLAAQLEPPVETFNKVQDTIKDILVNTSNAATLLVARQERLSRLLDENLKLSNPIETALTKLRKETFKKVEPSFFSQEFRAQFNSSLWSSLLDNFASAWETESDFFSRHAWSILFRLFMVFSIVQIFQAWRRSVPATGEWRTLLDHPWSLGVFLAEFLSSIIFPQATGLWRTLTWCLFVFSVSILFSGLLEKRRERIVVFLLAVFVTVSGSLKAISLPTPLYRLYLAMVTVAGIPLLFLWARRETKTHLGRLSKFSAGLLIGTTLMVVALMAQIAGFANLADRLLLAASGSVYIIIAAVLLLRISSLGIEIVLGQSLIARQHFVSRYGPELNKRLKAIMRIVIWCLALLYLLQTWGIHGSIGESFEKLILFHVTLGKLNLSLGIVVLALLVLYLASTISWFLRAVLKAEVFPRKQVDRGAADAITRLLHYSLILIGFLLSMSLIGFDLQSFVVLGGALGIGVGFGLQNIVNNFLSGLILLFERPVKVGDMVVVDNESGIVRKIGLRSTVIETFDQAEIFVPNSQLISQKVTNWTYSNAVARLRIAVGVAYGTDVERVFSLLTDIARANPRILPNPAPLPLLLGFGESNLNMELLVWLADVNERQLAQSELCQEIAERFQEKGIEIAFPQRDLRLRSADDGILESVLQKPSLAKNEVPEMERRQTKADG